MLIYDNATTHTKRPAGVPSASKMPMKPSDKFYVEVSVTNPVTGKLVYASDGKVLKEKVKMQNGKFADGTEQEFYYADTHEDPTLAGKFKGMRTILEERKIDVRGKKCQCGKTFPQKCDESKTCCIRQILYNQPDFSGSRSQLEIFASTHYDIDVIFLPKFHCELNPIEQCWGYAKRRYRLYDASTKEDDLERNLLSSLEAVPLVSIRR